MHTNWVLSGVGESEPWRLWRKITTAEVVIQLFSEPPRVSSRNLTFSPGNETDLAKYLQGILEREGIPSQLAGSDPKRLSLIASLKGSGAKKPILVMGHSDVVPVARDRWTEDPFGAKRIDGYIWGRGTS